MILCDIYEDIVHRAPKVTLSSHTFFLVQTFMNNKGQDNTSSPTISSSTSSRAAAASAAQDTPNPGETALIKSVRSVAVVRVLEFSWRV
jgi:hypothetical protein